ncbi:MAG: hypothetical protein WBW81_05035 [Methylocella sp.]
MIYYASAGVPIPERIGSASDWRSRMSKIKEVMLLALVADGSIEMKIADSGKAVNAIYDALKANGLLVASGKKNKKRKSK